MGEGSDEHVKPERLGCGCSAGHHSAASLSFPPAQPALVSRGHTQTPYPWAGAGRGPAASHLAHIGRDFGDEAQSWWLLPSIFTAGQGFRLSPAAEGAKSCPVTSFPRPRDQQEDLDLQSQSGHPCPAAVNAPNLPEIPGDLLALPRGTACVVPCVGWGEPGQRVTGPPSPTPCVPAIGHRYSAVAPWSHRAAGRAGGHGCRGMALRVSQLISIKVKARTSPPARPPALLLH